MMRKNRRGKERSYILCVVIKSSEYILNSESLHIVVSTRFES